MNPIQSGPWQIPGLPELQAGEAAKTAAGGFGEMLSAMIQNVEKANVEADHAVQGLLTGEAEDIHSVMVAVQKADISLRLALEVRNKLVEAYQEVMRMSV